MTRLFAALCCLLFSRAVASAPAPAAVALPHVPQITRCAGTVTEASGGVTTLARLQFQAPDQLRIEIEPNPAALVAGQTIVAAGDETRLYDASTKRLHRLPYNIVREWWHGWDLGGGGPANALLAGLSPQTLGRFYTSIPVASANAARTAVRLDARPEIGRLWIQDEVRFGGRGTAAYYAAFKRPIFDRPAAVGLVFDARTAQLLQRTDYADADHVAAVSELTSDAASGLPQSALVRDRNGFQLAQFTYDLKAAPGAFPDNTFSLDLAPDQIIEDLPLKPIGEYQAGQDAAARYNLGAAIARHTEDIPSALRDWTEAAGLQPQATAPHFAAFDTALAARDLTRAAVELDALARLLGAADFEVATRRAALATLRHDWPAAQAALDAAQRAQPQNLGVTLLQADLARARGDLTTARDLLLAILKSGAPQPASQVAAAEMLAIITANPSDPAAAAAVLAALPRDTQWQRLARAHLNLLTAKPAGETNFDSEVALASLALAYEREGQDAAAVAAWQQIVAKAPLPAVNAARLNVMALNARAGTVTESLRLYRELVDRSTDENTRRRTQDAIIAAWRKAYRQDQLRTALQQAVAAPAATEEDWRLWLAFQESNGSDEDIASALQGGLARFPRAAWWQSRWGEYLLGQAAAQPRQSAQYLQDADRSVQAAIEADPQQPFYQVQRALIFSQSAAAALDAPVIDAAQVGATVKAARDAIAGLQAKWPDDPDAQIAIAVQNMSIERTDRNIAVQGLREGLRKGNPGRESASGDRHTTASSVHQTLASLLRRMGRATEAAQEYEILLDSVRDADTELGIARNYLILLGSQRNPNPQAIADLMARLARQPWAYSPARDLIEGFAAALAERQPLVFDVANLLAKADDPAAHLAATYLNLALVQALQAQSKAPRPAPSLAPRPAPAPDTAQLLATATRELAASYQALAPVANGNDALLAGRAAALLAEAQLNARKPDQGVAWLQIAVNTDPHDVDLRLALAAAERLAGKATAAVAQRNTVLAVTPHNADILQRVAALSSDLKLPQDAARYAVQAMNLAQVVPDVPASQFQTTAFTAARTLFNANQTASAVNIYSGLANAQWDISERAAALMDLGAHYRSAAKTAEADAVHAQLTALNLTAAQQRAAQRIVLGLG